MLNKNVMREFYARFAHLRVWGPHIRCIVLEPSPFARLLVRSGLSFWGGAKSVIKIGGALVPNGTLPQWVTVENLVVQGANMRYVCPMPTQARILLLCSQGCAT